MLWIQFTLLKKKVKEHTHAMHEFLVCNRGRVEITTSDSQHALEPGGSIFIPSGIPHEIDCSGNDNGVMIACVDNATLSLLRTPNNRGYIDALTTQVSYGNPHLEEAAELMQCLNALRELKYERSRINQSLEENYFLRMLLLHSKRQQCLTQLGLDEKGKIEKVIEWLKINYHSEINIDELCLKFGMSRSQLTRKFKYYCGYSVIEYVLQLRFESAARMLAMTNKDVSEIALTSGISNLSHFHRQFKKRFGMTPIAFRNMTA